MYVSYNYLLWKSYGIHIMDNIPRIGLRYDDFGNAAQHGGRDYLYCTNRYLYHHLSGKYEDIQTQITKIYVGLLTHNFLAQRWKT